MRIMTLWGKRKDGTIELMVAWDEHCVEGNPEGFDEALEESRKSWGDDLAEDRPLVLDIPDQTIDRMFEPRVVHVKKVPEEE